MKKIVFIINPNSGVDRNKALKATIEKCLDLQQFQYEMVYTEYAQHGTELAQKASLSGADIVVAVGGDGSVNDIAKGLLGTEVALAIIPKGSGNGLARSLNIPLKAEKAIQLINNSKVISIDVGLVNQHIFLSNTGVGFDAVITQQFANSKKRGFQAYSQIIARNLFKYKPQKYVIEVDGQQVEHEAFMITVANAVQLGYGFKIAPEAELQDGLFDVIIIKKFPKLKAALIALRAFSGKILRSKSVIHLKGKHIRIHHPQLNSFQLDGEGKTCDVNSLEIQFAAEKLNILVANKKPT